jgi:hypothetical protein
LLEEEAVALVTAVEVVLEVTGQTFPVKHLVETLLRKVLFSFYWELHILLRWVTVVLVETARPVQMVKTQFFLLSLLSVVAVEVPEMALAVKWVALVVVVVTQITEVLEPLIKALVEEMVQTQIQFTPVVVVVVQELRELLQALQLEERVYLAT